MPEHKRRHQSAPGAEAAPHAAAAAAPRSPVPLPVARRAPDLAGTAAFAALPAAARHATVAPNRVDHADTVGTNHELPGVGTADFDFDQATRPRRSKEDGPALPPRRGELNQLDHLQNYQASPRWWHKIVSPKDQFAGTPTGKFSAASTETKRAEVAQVKAGEEPGKKNPHQPVADLGEIYAHCSMLEAQFKHEVERVAAEATGKAVFRPGGKMKSIDRTLEKITADYKGDVSRIVDLTGGSISFDNADDLVAGFGKVVGTPGFRVVRVKNSLVKGKGYGDINLSIELGSADFELKGDDGVTKTEHYSGYIVELQLHLAPIIKAKEAAHKPYEKQRTIDAKHGTNKDRGTWDAADRNAWKSLEDQMQDIYGSAWEQIGGTAARDALQKIKPQNPT